MLDTIEKPLSENDQLILQQLIENLAQQSDTNPRQEMSVDSSEDHQENRSETPSSNNDTELNEAELEDNGEEMTIDSTAEVAKQLQFVGHQLVKLLCGMGQAPCMCSNCTQQLKKTLPLIHGKNSTETSSDSANQVNKSTNGLNNSGIIEFNEDGSIKRGRRSKYCSSQEKQEVADYAEIHGATAAARKFEIPASVAAYYHRKIKKGYTGPGASVPRRSYAPYPNPVEIKAVQDSRQQSLETSGEDNENQRSQVQNNESFGRSPGGAFLRGRGRGRPKLIGDELDAELVEYMVSVKSKLPRAHLTASNALEIARAYIMEKAPQILEENGGHISLKITWAMKLVSRTNERWRELNGGPPSPFDANNTSLLQINNQLNDFIAQLSSQNGVTPEMLNAADIQFPFSIDNKSAEISADENNSIKPTFIQNDTNGHLIAE